jgi:hypothetical protein
MQNRKGAAAQASPLTHHFAAHLWTYQWTRCIFFGMSKEQNTELQKSEVLQGTLDLKAKYYSITKSGRKQLARETENWERIAGVIGRLLRLEGQEYR